MSLDTPPTNSPVAATSKGGGKKLFLFGGLGCFTLFLLCGGGGLYVYTAFIQPVQQLIESSALEAEISQVVLDELGPPVIVNRTNISQRNDKETLFYSLPVSGGEKSGRLVIEARYEGGEMNRTGLKLEVDGQEIDLLADDPLGDIDIDIPGL